MTASIIAPAPELGSINPDIGTPEAIFAIRPDIKEPLNGDALLCIIDRAASVVEMLMDCGSNGSGEGFSVSHKTVINGLWTLDGLLSQGSTIVRHDMGIADPTPLDIDLDADTAAKLDAHADNLGITREQAITNIVGDYLADMGAAV